MTEQEFEDVRNFFAKIAEDTRIYWGLSPFDTGIHIVSEIESASWEDYNGA